MLGAIHVRQPLAGFAVLSQFTPLVGAIAFITTERVYAAPVYFLVAELPGQELHRDSFVVGLEDPQHIAHARDLIARGPDLAGDPILVATIAPGADGLNRDYRAPNLPPWNWHVVGVDGFFGTTAEILDGWPTFVEDDVSGWIANTQGKIGFWSYTVVEELAVPEPSGLLLAGLGALALLSRRQSRVAASPTRNPGERGGDGNTAIGACVNQRARTHRRLEMETTNVKSLSDLRDGRYRVLTGTG